MLQGKKVTVIGSGISGIAAAGLLKRHSAIVTIYDGNAQADVQGIKEKAGDDINVICGEWTKELKENTELLVVSPGVPTDLPFLLEMKQNGVPMWGEVEPIEASRGRLRSRWSISRL